MVNKKKYVINMHIFIYSITFIEFCITYAGAGAWGSSQRVSWRHKSLHLPVGEKSPYFDLHKKKNYRNVTVKCEFDCRFKKKKT